MTGADPAPHPPGQMTETEFRALYGWLHGQLPWDRMTGAGR